MKSRKSSFSRMKILFLFMFPCLGYMANEAAGQSRSLFDSDEPLSITLKGNLRDLLNDRTSTPKNFPVDLIVNSVDNRQMSIPVQMKTRGHFRRLKENCVYPPLLIQFGNDSIHKGTVFKHQKKLKLVMPCRGDEYTIKEWLVYKMYNLVTPLSFNARLVQVTLDDTRAKKPTDPMYGILLEDEDQMAKRNQMIVLERKIIPQQSQVIPFLTMAVFEYMIGNTDWGVQYLQNIKLVARDSTSRVITVAYDFDHAGIVGAPYALPAPELDLSSIKERRYRGYCIQSMSPYEEVLVHFNQLKDKMYALYTDCKLLDSRSIKTATQFLDGFYATINDPKKWQRDFLYPCDKNGTGNVVLKGLKK